jgi:hypothetical protein
MSDLPARHWTRYFPVFAHPPSAIRYSRPLTAAPSQRRTRW